MTIYEFGTSLLTQAGSTQTITLPIFGGLCRQFLVTANTATTVFRANIVDDHGRTRMSWGFSTGQLNETSFALPMVNRYKINITNASPNDTFNILLAVQE